MKTSVLVPIIEGYAEMQSAPLLLRRLLAKRGQYEIKIARPIRIGRYRIVRPNELERAIELARRRTEGCHAIMILLDADDDCPKELAPILLQRARKASAGIPVSIVLAKREFEAWFLGSLESLRNIRGLSPQATPPERPEEIRDAKGYLSHGMVSRRTYLEVDDQPAFAEKFDLALSRQRCPSFDKFMREVDALLSALT